MSERTISLIVQGSGIKGDVLRKIHQSLGPDRDEKCRVTALEAPEPDPIHDALTPPSSACVEVIGDIVVMGPVLAELSGQNSLYLSLSTASAYRLQPARLFCAALAERLVIDKDCLQNMELAIHEAVVNGVVHGNLGIPSGGREDIEQFMEFCQKIETGLLDHAVNARPIEIGAWWDEGKIMVAIRDSGPGYHPDENAVEPMNRKSGRGLGLIRSLADDVEIADGGCRVVMRFPL